jgi:hypothetical protein
MDESLLHGVPYTASIYVEYEVLGADYSVLDASYEVEEQPYDFATLDGAYQVIRPTIEEWEPTETPVTQWTQIIGNKFPVWHAARRRRGSTIQRIVNSISGYHISAFIDEVSLFRNNRFLPTVDLSELDTIYSVMAPSRRSPPLRNNLLVNSDFSIPGLARLGTAWTWNDGLRGSTGRVSLTQNASLFGTYGSRLTAVVGNTTHVKQTRDLQLQPGTSVTASVYYAGMLPALAALIEEAYLSIQVQYSDGTIETWRKALKRGTDGGWDFKYLTAEMSRETHTVTVLIGLDNRFGDYDLYLDVGAVKLELGDKASPWSASEEDEQAYSVVQDKTTIEETVGENDLSYDRVPRVKLFTVDNFEFLDRDSLPRRMSISEAEDEVAINKNRVGIRVDKDGSRFSIGWRVDDDLVVSYNADIALDEVYDEYRVADFYADHRYDEKLYLNVEDLGVDQTVEVLTVHRGLIWVVVKEEYLDRTVRVLKVCSPGLRWDETNHLESLREIPIDDGDGSCTFVGFVENSSDRILFTIDDVNYVGTLEYDDSVMTLDGLLLTRTSHDGQVMAV